MSINIESVAEKIFNILKGFGYPVNSYGDDGKIAVDPSQATRFVVNKPNLLVRIDRETDTISLSTSEKQSDTKLHKMLKNLSQEYLMNFDFRIFGKTLKPKGETVDIAKKQDPDMMEDINRIRKLAGLAESWDDYEDLETDPMDPPVNMCPDCEGTGTDTAGETCQSCGGEGAIHEGTLNTIGRKMGISSTKGKPDPRKAPTWATAIGQVPSGAWHWLEKEGPVETDDSNEYFPLSGKTEFTGFISPFEGDPETLSDFARADYNSEESQMNEFRDDSDDDDFERGQQLEQIIQKVFRAAKKTIPLRSVKGKRTGSAVTEKIFKMLRQAIDADMARWVLEKHPDMGTDLSGNVDTESAPEDLVADELSDFIYQMLRKDHGLPNGLEENQIDEETLNEIAGTLAGLGAGAIAAALKKYGKSKRSAAQRTVDTYYSNKNRDEEGAEIADKFARNNRGNYQASKRAVNKVKRPETKKRHQDVIDQQNRAYKYYDDNQKKSYIKQLSPSESLGEGFGSMTGSSKTSYQPLDNVKIVVKHKKPVAEDVRGARSRNIHSIFIQRGEERFKMAENSLPAARAVARHISKGGEMHDEISEQIINMASDYEKLREFVRYVKSSNLVNESNEDYVQLAVENIKNIRETFKKLSGAKSYEKTVESLVQTASAELLEDDVDLESKFTETHFDSKVENVLGTLKTLSYKKKAYEAAITKAVKTETFENLKDMLHEADVLDFQTPQARLGYQINQLGHSATNPELGQFLQGLSKRVTEGGSLNQFEYGTVKSCLLSANTVPQAPATGDDISESYVSFFNQFD